MIIKLKLIFFITVLLPMYLYSSTETNLESNLINACISRDLKKVKDLIKKGANINYKNFNNRTPLLVAIINEDKEIINLLIKHKVSLDIKNQIKSLDFFIKGESDQAEYLIKKYKEIISLEDQFIDSAIVKNHSKVLALLDKIKNIDYVDKDGYSLLIAVAAFLDSREVVIKMLNRNFEVDFQNNQGYSPLMLASRNGNKESVKVLLENKANIDLQNCEGKTALHFAAESKKRDIVNLLIAYKANINLITTQSETCLIYATLAGDKESMSILIKAGSNVDSKDSRGLSALHYAVTNNDAEAVKLLISNNAKKDIQNHTYGFNFLYSPLHYAVENNNYEIAKILIEAGANINIKENQKNTPLNLAILNKNIALVDLLIKSEAKLNITNKDNQEPLEIAIKKNLPEIVKLLLQAGAPVNYKDEDKFIPLYYVAKKSNIELAKILLEATTKEVIKESYDSHGNCIGGSLCLYVAIAKGNEQMYNLLISYGAQNHVDKEFLTYHLLDALTLNTNTEKALLSIKLGANVNYYEKIDASRQLATYRAIVKESRPLHLSVHPSIDISVTLALIKAGADVNAKNLIGHTPIHCASMFGNVNGINALIKAGADVNAKDYDGLTPLDIAKTEEVKKILIEAGVKK